MDRVANGQRTTDVFCLRSVSSVSCSSQRAALNPYFAAAQQLCVSRPTHVSFLSSVIVIRKSFSRLKSSSATAVNLAGCPLCPASIFLVIYDMYILYSILYNVMASRETEICDNLQQQIE